MKEKGKHIAFFCLSIRKLLACRIPPKFLLHVIECSPTLKSTSGSTLWILCKLKIAKEWKLNITTYNQKQQSKSKSNCYHECCSGSDEVSWLPIDGRALSFSIAHTRSPKWQYPEAVGWNQARSTRTRYVLKVGFAWVSSQLITCPKDIFRCPRWTKRSWAFRPATSRYHMVGGIDWKVIKRKNQQNPFHELHQYVIYGCKN
jgi:hypothetical protein